MSQIKISDLVETTSVDEELCMVPVDDGTATKKISLKNLSASATESAETYALAAAASASSASDSAAAAAQSSSNAGTYAANAAESATDAQGSASSASSSADQAAAAASNASASAGNAAASATSVAQQVASAEASATLARSWAEGGTGARAGEDTNNAKHWAETAAAMHDGVASFNGRQGIVNPESGDYSSNMISRGSSTIDDDLTSLENDMSDAKGDIEDLQTDKEDAPTTLVATLAAGATSLVFTDDSIKADSLVDGYSDPYGVTPTNATGEVGRITLTFDPQETATKITLLIR